jgi:uncharacterized membrane-anchored protein
VTKYVGDLVTGYSRGRHKAGALRGSVDDCAEGEWIRSLDRRSELVQMEVRQAVPLVAISKIAEVTLCFWIMKVLATTLGETAGDYISMSLGLGYYVGLGITFAILALILVLQIVGPTYRPAVFWAAIIATTTVGTEISDFLDRSLGLGYAWGSTILLSGLFASLAIWYAREGSLRVYPIVRRDVELLFWLTVLLSNSLGTAFGDFLVDVVGLTFLQGALVTAGVIAAVGAAHYFTRLNDVALFWTAFIFTRPFGATFGDFLTKPLDHGGLDLPRSYASLLTLALLAAVLFVSGDRSRTRAPS